MEKKAFLFYLNWKDQIDDLDDQELRRLINNLIKYHLGEEVELQTKIDRIVWKGILPGLEANQDKWDQRVQANRENGKLGGAPKGNGNARKDKNNPNQPKQPDNREQGNDNREMGNENRKEIIDSNEEMNENNELENETNKTKNQPEVPYYTSSSSNITKSQSGMSIFEYNKQRGFL